MEQVIIGALIVAIAFMLLAICLPKPKKKKPKSDSDQMVEALRRMLAEEDKR